MPENRGNGNMRMTDWPSKVLRIHIKKFRVRLAPFTRARSKMTESGDVSFYSQSTSKVAQRALRESSEDSNDERENDTLTKALQTKEQQDHFCGVFSKLA
jgi:hypothetical protein